MKHLFAFFLLSCATLGLTKMALQLTIRSALSLVIAKGRLGFDIDARVIQSV